MRRRRRKCYLQRWGSGGYRTQMTRPGRVLRVLQNKNPFQIGLYLFQKFEPFGSHRILVVCKPGYVPSRTSQTFNKTADNWICDLNKNDGNCRRRLTNGGKHRNTMREDDVRRKPDSLRSRLLDPIVICTGPAKIENQIGFGGPTETLKAVDQGGDPSLRVGIGFRKWDQDCDSTNPSFWLGARNTCP